VHVGEVIGVGGLARRRTLGEENRRGSRDCWNEESNGTGPLELSGGGGRIWGEGLNLISGIL